MDTPNADRDTCSNHLVSFFGTPIVQRLFGHAGDERSEPKRNAGPPTGCFQDGRSILEMTFSGNSFSSRSRPSPNPLIHGYFKLVRSMEWS